MYTAPAYFMALLCCLTLYLLAFHFQNRQRIPSTKEKKKSTRRQAIEDYANTATSCGLTIYDACLLGCMLLNVASKGSIGSFETMGIALADTHFGMSSSNAGTIVGACGTVGVVVLLNMGRLGLWFNDVQLISGGLIVMATGIASLISLQNNAENPSWRYAVAIFLIYAIGYPIGHTAVIGLFSKGKALLGGVQSSFTLSQLPPPNRSCG